MSLSADERRELDAVLPHYPDRRAAAGQRAAGRAAPAALALGRGAWPTSARYLGMSVEELDGLATFGNMLFRRPVGRHIVLVCDSFACWSLGYAELREAIEAAARRGHGRDHAGRPLHAAAHRLPGRLRPRARR